MSNPAGLALGAQDPSTVGPWRILRRLGAGGMGVVYLAEHGSRQAALKVIRPGLLDDPQVGVRFAREVKVVRAVRDVHISEFLDADLESEPAWLAVEYLAGPTLRDHVLEEGPLPAQQWWAVARGLSQALAVLQVHGVTHRDLKPANVILADRGPVLIDFGIAHPDDATQLTATGMVTGSPSWLSPEQAEQGVAGPSSDVFSLGSLLAYAATGRPPFGQGAPVAVLVAISSKDPDLAGIDRQRASLLRKMLNKKPDARPTAQQVLAVAKRHEAAFAAQQAAVPSPSDRTAEMPTIRGHDADAATLIVPSGAAPDAPPMLDATAVAAVQDQTLLTRTTRALTKSRSRKWVSALVGLMLGGFLIWGMTLGSGEAESPQPPESSAPAETPDPEGPAAPSGDQLRSGDWLLARYAIDQESGNYVVTGTVQNDGATAASTDLTVYLYIGGEQVGVVSGGTEEVPAGGSTQVRLTGDSPWQQGQPTLLVEAG